ncbi:entericidin A/B family lipoprotein [Spiribacter vilamensis]|uniref:Putative small secreted protein n=1 Tax=Spiribacter vilamensis TaxID=531306 RepID=A0A4Q8D0Q6_9GAMM|nr:entericidin A/B family lipoprotein [Spiribacter vilamensis]RZU98909.1 putative small secreted protein [Spiribacter vilamensis]TVO62079.1 entericidin A/B family lipoprotein [Spiribacter vilamensis]
MPVFNFRQTLNLAGITLVIILITGCNTMEGAGKDIQKAGQALESSADRNE